MTLLRPYAFRLPANAQRPFGGGWLYVLDLRITNREAESITLIPDLLVMTNPEDPERGARNLLHAADTPATEVDEQLRLQRRVNWELSDVAHLPAPIVIPAKGTVRDYVSFRLPETMIRHFPGGINEQTPEMSPYPPDTDRLGFRDELSDHIHVIQPFDAFQQQRMEAQMQRIMKVNRERAAATEATTDKGGNLPSTFGTEDDQP